MRILRFASGIADVPTSVWSKAGVVASILRETVLHPFQTSVLIPDDPTDRTLPDGPGASGRIEDEPIRESA